MIEQEEIFKSHFVDGKVWIPPRGTTQAKLMIVISHPNHEDVRTQRVLAGENGEAVSDALRNAGGMKDSDCWITSIVKYSLGNKSKPTSAQLEEATARFKEEVDLVKPELIMTLGADAFKFVMGTNIKQGDYLGELVDSPYGKVMPNHSAGLVVAIDPSLKSEFEENFLYAKKYVCGELKFTPFYYKIISDPKENLEILNEYMAAGKWTIGYDAEWHGKKYTQDEVMFTFQYSCEPDCAIILDISTDGKTENRELLDTMKCFIENPNADRVGWNIRSDDKRLKLRGFNVPDATLGFDGMKAVAFFDSRWGKGLETGIKRFTTYNHYYVELAKYCKDNKLDKSELATVKLLNPDIFYRYCAGDAVSHFTACNNMRTAMKTHMKPQLAKYYFDTYLPLTTYLLDLETTGIPIDVELMEDLTKKYTERYTQLKDELLVQLKEIKIDEFNPNAAGDKISLLYDTLKLDPAYYTKSGKNPKPRAWYKQAKYNTRKSYNPSANGKAIATLRFELEQSLANKDYGNETERVVLERTYLIVKKLLQVGRTSVFANKFFSKKGTSFLDDISDDEGYEDDPLKASYWNALHSDGKIHADFYECLDNFRSSSRVNVQNPASKVLAHIPECFEGSQIEVPENIRRIFYTGDKDWYYGEADCAGADLAIMASLSKDPDFINDMRSGNFHLKKTREYFRNDKLTKKDTSHYTTAKSITFRVSYTAELEYAAIPIQAEIFAESGLLIPIDDIAYALNTWNDYKHYIAYRERCKSQVRNDFCIENARGMKLTFEKTKNFGVMAGWLNESLAFPIASELALFMWDVSVQMKDQLVRDGNWMKWIKPCNTIHDAHHWLIHKDMMKDNYFPEICREYFSSKVKLATGDNLGVELVVSDRWKGKEKFFSNETEWDFNEKCWKWKTK